MALHHSADVSKADWLVTSGTPWDQLLTYGPQGFEAYARLRFIPDPVQPGQAEADVDVSDDHLPELAQCAAALQVLRGFTGTDEWFYCIWEGSGFAQLPRSVLNGPLVELPPRVVGPYRRYALLTGNPADIEMWEPFFGGSAPVPAYVWPADRAWCFTSDVDPHWAGIAGDQQTIEALMQGDLDVCRADPSEPAPQYA